MVLMKPPLAPTVVTVGLVSIALALAVLFVLGHSIALRRLGFVHSVAVRRTWIAGVAGVAAAIWLAAFFGVASTGLLARFELRPPPLVFALVAIVAGAVVFASSRTGATVARGLPIAALIGAQAFRLPLELVMHEAARAGTMPVQMSFSGWNFDIVTGITACLVAPLAATGRASRGLLVAWNVLGSSLLFTIIAIAVASTPGRRVWANPVQRGSAGRDVNDGTTWDGTVGNTITGGTTAVVGISNIAVGNVHNCVILNGGVQCWGSNYYGQLGNNSKLDSSIPVQVRGLTSGATAIAAGGAHTCAVINGGVQCWGYNGFGQLGNSSTTDSAVPVQVQGATSGATAVATGTYQTCALVNGSAYCWGYNPFGELGNNSTTNSPVPVQVVGLTSNVTVISAGGLHSCALLDSSVYCWGHNSQGELGNNSTTNSPIPIRVSGLTSSVTDIHAGGDYTSSHRTLPQSSQATSTPAHWSTVVLIVGATIAKASSAIIPRLTAGFRFGFCFRDDSRVTPAAHGIRAERFSVTVAVS